jgi:multidrug efflux pump subunit AcrB
MQAQIERAAGPATRRADRRGMDEHGDLSILGYARTSDTRSLSELRELADFRLKPELAQIPGVSQVRWRAARTGSFRSG